jgi:hypothetical protein
VETQQMLKDAEVMGRLDEIGAHLRAVLEREQFIADLFAARSFAARCRVVWRAGTQPVALRLRLWVYAAAPWLLAPFFALKRLSAKRKQA